MPPILGIPVARCPELCSIIRESFEMQSQKFTENAEHGPIKLNLNSNYYYKQSKVWDCVGAFRYFKLYVRPHY